MLPRSQRLSVKQFEFIMKNGRVAHSSLFLMRVCEGQSGKRIAAVASMKVAKKAVQRNYTRRLIYESVRPLYASLKEGTHGIVFAKAGVAETSLPLLKEDIKSLFAKAGVLK